MICTGGKTAVSMIMKRIRSMRRIFTYPAFLALLLTVALAGCQKEPRPLTDDVIRFSVSSVGISSASTKADPLIPGLQKPADPLVEFGCQVKVWASLSTDNTTWKSVFDNPSFMLENVKGAWTYSGDKYWNRDASYKFMGLYPVDADFQSDSNVDLLKVNYKNNAQDLMVATTKLAGAGAKKVDLAFLHMCSAVRVYFVDPDRGEQAVRYKITDFKLQNLYMAGTLTINQLTSPNWATSGERTTGYSWPETPGSTWDVPSDYTEFPKTEDKAAPWLFFIPQELADNSALSFTYEVNMGDGSTQLLPVTIPINKHNETDIVWAPGMVYSYYVMIRPTGIKFTVEWTDWITEGNDDTLTIE